MTKYIHLLMSNAGDRTRRARQRTTRSKRPHIGQKPRRVVTTNYGKKQRKVEKRTDKNSKSAEGQRSISAAQQQTEIQIDTQSK